MPSGHSHGAEECVVQTELPCHDETGHSLGSDVSRLSLQPWRRVNCTLHCAKLRSTSGMPSLRRAGTVVDGLEARARKTWPGSAIAAAAQQQSFFATAPRGHDARMHGEEFPARAHQDAVSRGCSLTARPGRTCRTAVKLARARGHPGRWVKMRRQFIVLITTPYREQ